MRRDRELSKDAIISVLVMGWSAGRGSCALSQSCRDDDDDDDDTNRRLPCTAGFAALKVSPHLDAYIGSIENSERGFGGKPAGQAATKACMRATRATSETSRDIE